ncbi:nitroreductase family protein [Lacticaseibacillus thailandensis]|nr:nitroreductase family protein [Lacticaseibacillus thailandensis]
MDTLTTINQRHAIRNYTGAKPTTEQLKQILTAAESAPVAMGQFERYHLTVIEDPDTLAAINTAAAAAFHGDGGPMLYGAPVFVLVSVDANGGELSNADYSSAAIIAHTMALAATDLGLGTCYIWGAVAGLVQSPDTVAQLQLPAGFVPTCGITLGPTTEQYAPRPVDEHRIGVTQL